MHIIINWSGHEDIEFVRNEDGSVMLFKTLKEATCYAENELNFYWEIVEV